MLAALFVPENRGAQVQRRSTERREGEFSRIEAYVQIKCPEGPDTLEESAGATPSELWLKVFNRITGKDKTPELSVSTQSARVINGPVCIPVIL